jgi:hypothetical protein
MAFNTAKNIIIGAAPLFISVKDSTQSTYVENLLDTPGSTGIAFTSGTSAKTALAAASTKVRNVGFTNNGLQITYNPTYDSVTVDQLLDTAKLFKSAMEVMIATEMTEGTLENIMTVFGQPTTSLSADLAAGTDQTLSIRGGSLLEAPTERQLFAVGNAPTTVSASTERVYYARRVLSVQQTAHSLSRNTASTFPVTFRLLPDANYAGSEYGKIIDRVIS